MFFLSGLYYLCAIIDSIRSSRSNRPFDRYPDPYVFNAIDPVQMALTFVAVPILVLMPVPIFVSLAVRIDF